MSGGLFPSNSASDRIKGASASIRSSTASRCARFKDLKAITKTSAVASIALMLVKVSLIFLRMFKSESNFIRRAILFSSKNGRLIAAADPKHALSRRHADWESGGHHVARVARVARVRRGRRRGHAAHRAVAQTF